ncbi:hypothetical protein [Polyangium spumosum]|uniref:Uncharacterized protein n=1 Tax=Polyangium spumosum TaxID=889282 RepID=A0A6N7PIT4_9BACT|nr:hypothetical protein [Polyangium spumosum]MRG92022.1 hypothetical protein [Polyangium spumosum]
MDVFRFSASAFAALLIAACGGGGSSNAGGAGGAGASGGHGGAGAGPITPPAGDRNVVTYAGHTKAEVFSAVIALSDGSILVGGSAEDLAWVPEGVPREELSAGNIHSSATGKIAFLMQIGKDLTTIQRVAHFPAGTVRDVRRIRTTNLPGQPTGSIYISGSRDVSDPMQDGYYLAKLDGNFVDGEAISVAWTYDVEARPRKAAGYAGESAYETIQPWDVGSDGSVVYGRGSEYDFDWAAIEKLGPDGKPTTVEAWPAHWGASGEFRGLASQYPGGAAEHSAIVMKAGRAGSLRSTSAEDYTLVHDDGNGNTKQGKWPDDYYFSGPCLPSPGECAGGPGYTGYRTSDKPTQRVGGIVIDRKTGDLYFGYSTQSVLPGGNPDFEPAVVAMAKDGKLKWWSRLYQETDQNSTPDQYVDHVAIDDKTGALVVVGRSHGNNVINLWSGDEVAANPGATSFHNGFTGTNGNIHISWLGKLGLDDGKLAAASWVAEYADGMKGTGEPYADPNLDGWPSHNAAWPDLNTTRVSSLEVDAEGRVYLTASGRRTITTRSAYQKMLKKDEGSSTWNSFVRVFSPSLDTLVYSSLIVGTWDPATGAGGDNTSLLGVLPLDKGVIAVGKHEADEMTGMAKGNPIPTENVPAWGTKTPEGESAIFAHLLFESP